MPTGLMSYNPGSTATPPLAPPPGRPAGLGGGLFGGGVPYPVTPDMQQGLMRDAWRAFGVGLLGQSMNANIPQGLAQALAAGRQAYAGGAEQAYQVGRQGEQDEFMREARQAQIESARSLAEERRRKPEEEARKAEEMARNREEALAAIENLPVSDQQKAAMRFRVQFGMGDPTESMLLPQEEKAPPGMQYRSAAGTVYQIDPVTGQASVVPGMPGPKAAGGAPPDAGMSESTRRQLAMAEWKAAADAQVEAFEAYKRTPTYRDLAATTAMGPPPAPDLAPFLAKYGLSVGAAGPDQAEPAGTAPAASPDRVLSALPPEVAATPGLREQVERDLAGGSTPGQILEQIQAVLGGGR